MTKVNDASNLPEWLSSAGISRESQTVLWQQIADLLARNIQLGAIKPGEQLPTEHTLAAHFGVNRHTIRRAFSHLEAASLLQVERGRGTFVHENVVDYMLSRRTRFSENLRRLNLEPSGIILDMGEKEAPMSIARALHIEPNDPIIWVRKLSYADDRAISLSESSFAKRRFEGFLDVYKQRQSVTATFAYFGIFDYTRKNTRITARMPSVDEMELLKLPRNRPILVTESVNIDTDGLPIEYGRTAFHGEVVQLVIDSDEIEDV